jgi:hypothetical protein
VCDFESAAGASGAVNKLKVTTGIGCRNGINAGGEDVFEFPFLQVGGHLWLRDVVDSRAPAAPS